VNRPAIISWDRITVRSLDPDVVGGLAIIAVVVEAFTI
jgi:hypothetical protein